MKVKKTKMKYTKEEEEALKLSHRLIQKHDVSFNNVFQRSALENLNNLDSVKNRPILPQPRNTYVDAIEGPHSNRF